MKIHLTTAIDKYKNQFGYKLHFVPELGTMVKTLRNDSKKPKEIPFDELEVQSVTHYPDGVVISLHYSELQRKQAEAYKLDLF